MESGDPDAPSQKRLRLDPGDPNPPYNARPPPPLPLQSYPTRHPTQASSPLPNPHRHLPAHGLPPPSQPYPPQGPPPGPAHFPSHQPSPSSLPPLPRPVSPPPLRTHGLPNATVTLPARTPSLSRDNLTDYPRPPLPSRSSAPEQPISSRSTSTDTKPSSSMDHAWPSVNPEHRPNGSFSNGYPPVVSPPQPQESPYQAPPLSAGPHYGPPPPGPYAQTPYMGGPAAQYASQNQVRRKQVRATQACNHCRSRKQKCDEARPCQFCRENNFDCQYKDVPPPKQDRSMMQLQDSVNSISDTLRTFVEGFNSWKHSVEARLPPPKFSDPAALVSNQPSPEQSYGHRASMSEHDGSRMPTPIQGRSQVQRVSSMKTESPVVPHSHVSPLPVHASTPIKQEPILAAPQPPATPADSVRTDHTAGGETKSEKMGLQGDHTTPAHQILEDWPSMANFYNDAPTIKHLMSSGMRRVADYPMLLEQARGLVRVWGVGEGLDANDGASGPASPESHGSLDAPSPPPPKDGLWGKMDPLTPPTTTADLPLDSNGLPPGGLGPDGNLRLDEHTLWKLHDSYDKNMHSLHPFLNPHSLKKMVQEFIAMYSPEHKGVQPLAGVKRKRSANSFGDSYSGQERPSGDTIERSLRNAIVLLVFALGKACEWKRPLPAPQGDKGLASSPYSGSTPRSANNSFSSDESTDYRPRNIDILPGMAYFSYATDILGNQQGGNTVSHAQAMLLAALYVGQFARVLESWSWIHNACRICLVLIKADMSRINRHVLFNNSHPVPQFSQKETYRLNLVKCVYWTCLQLETDILAEMSTLPPSEISKYQEEISYPSGVFEKFPDVISYNDSSEHDKTMWIYSSQIHLRVILNEAHNTLYSAGGRKKPPGLDVHNLKEVANAARVHADILQSWRRLLPSELDWNDSEPPSTDINIARLRAKFYGGHYMILRPFLFLAVHEIELPPGPPVSGWSSQTNSPAATSDAPTPTNTHGAHRALMELTSEQSGVLIVAHQCINSAIQSTIAFDRVGCDPDTTYQRFEDTPKDRLIVTNIFGTLHAQFGNILVLSSVYKSKLRNHLPRGSELTKQNLAYLFKRTITRLKEVAPNSPILKADYEILENVRKVIGIPAV